METPLYLVVEETLTRVTRHANAICDDKGRGFDIEAQTGRLGVLGMGERLSIVGGTLRVGAGRVKHLFRPSSFTSSHRVNLLLENEQLHARPYV